ncbi:MAG: hypothetical protein RIB97_06250 [Nitratireductor sp.]
MRHRLSGAEWRPICRSVLAGREQFRVGMTGAFQTASCWELESNPCRNLASGRGWANIPPAGSIVIRSALARTSIAAEITSSGSLPGFFAAPPKEWLDCIV